MKKFFLHAQNYILRGLIAIIPLLLSYFAIRLLYVLIDKRVMTFLAQYFDIRQIPGLGILLVLVCLYFIGLIFSNVVGRQIFRVIEVISERIPIVKVVYGIGKQLSDSLSMTEPNKQAFKKAVLVETFNGGGWMLGFVTGTIKGPTGEEMLKVFVPAVPHPLTGIIFIVKPSQTMDSGWTIEEALKIILSAGIISAPTEIRKV